MFYNNEVDVGKAVHQKIAEGVVERKDLFIVSKVRSKMDYNRSLTDVLFIYLFAVVADIYESRKSGADPSKIFERSAIGLSRLVSDPLANVFRGTRIRVKY